jgi:3D (Asp-Asp-Asp) domain-containing protein
VANLTNTAEGTSGNAVAASAIGLPDALDASLVSGASTTLTYDNAHAHLGSTSFKVHMSTAASVAYVAWKAAISGAPVSDAYCRFYLYLTAYPSATTRIAGYLGSATNRTSLRLTTTGTIRTNDAAGATIATTTAVVPLGAWCRIEYEQTAISGTTGTVAARLYSGANLDTATPDTGGSLSNAAQPVGGTVDEVRYGVPTSTTQTVAWDAWLDDLGWSSTAALGPASVSVSVTPTTVAGTTTVSAPAPTTGSKVSPTAVAGSVTVPAPAPGAGSVVTAVTVAGVVALPSSAVSTGSTAAPAVVACTATVGSPAPTAGALALAAVVACTAAVGVPALAAGSGVTPAAIAGSASVPTPTVEILAGGGAGSLTARTSGSAALSDRPTGRGAVA